MRRTLLGLFVVGAVLAGVLWTRALPSAHQHAHPAMATIDLAGFLTLGLLGGFGHCVGMCSPFVLFVSRRSRGVLAPQLWYTAGRILTYAALGALAGALGGAVELAGALLGVRRAAAVIAGLVLVVWALAALADLSRRDTGAELFARIAGTVKTRMPSHPFAVGLFLGLLLCGLVYSAVIAAVSRGSALQGACAVALFGLGTAPALLGVSFADDFLVRRRALVNRLAQVFILVMGAWFMWGAFASASATSGRDRIAGLLSLPEVFGNGPCDKFEPKEIMLYAAPDSQVVVGSIRVDRYWTFPKEGGCEGLKVGVHRNARANGVELPTLEYGYEELGAIVLEQRGQWFNVRLNDGAAWLRASARAQYFPLERLLTNSMTYLTDAFDGRLSPSPGSTGRTQSGVVAGRDVRVSGFRHADGELWIEVEVLSGSLCAPEKPTVIHRGWLPAHAESGKPTVWFHSRGC